MQDARLNYATYVLETIRRDRPAFLADPTHQSRVPFMDEATSVILRSQKFLLPPGGEFLERIDTVSRAVDFPRLPSEAVCLEFEYRFRMNPDGTLAKEESDLALNQPDMCCVLAYYPSEDSPWMPIIRHHYGRTPEHGEFLVWPLMGFRAGRRYRGTILPEPHFIIIPRAALLMPGSERRTPYTIEFAHTHREKRVLMCALATADVWQLIVEVEKGSADRALRAFGQDHITEVLATVELCSVLARTNTHTEVLAAPERLNRKRATSHRAPFFEYRVLKLAKNYVATGLTAGGTLAGPASNKKPI